MLNYGHRILANFLHVIFYYLMYKSLAKTFSYNLFFVLSGGGTLNYFGAKGFIEQELEGFVC